MSEETLNNLGTSSVPANSGSDAGSNNAPVQGGESQGQGTQGTPARPDSGNGSKDAKPELGDVVKRALDPAGKSSDPKAQGSNLNNATNPDGTKKDAADPAAAAEEKKLNEHPRFREVIAQKNELKKQNESLTAQLTDFNNVTTFMRESGLTGDEASKGFTIMAAMKNDPAKALELLTPYVIQLQQFVGTVLPPELQARVDAGLLLPEDARAMVRSQNQTGLLQAQRQQEHQRFEQARNQAQTQQHWAGVTSAVGGWEEQQKKIDPDYVRIEPFLLDAVKASFANKVPRSPQEAVEDVKRLYEGIRTNLRGFVPARQAIAPLPSSTASSNTASAVPSSPLEAVQQALARKN